MWKTRFEVSTSHSNGLTRHRNRSSSSRIVHHYYSRPLPTVSRVREDSPSAIVRPSPPSSIPNLEILLEEDEDIPCTNLRNNEQPNFLLRKPSSYQTMNKYQIVLPTIIESNDHECNQSMDETYSIKLNRQDSFVATNSNQILNDNNERKEEILNTNNNNQMMEFTLNKRINELLQEKVQRQNQFTSSSTEQSISNTFKNLSAFFENKALEASTNNISQSKKIIRAKRSLLLNRYIPNHNNDISKLEIISSIEKESNRFNHQIKRIKTSHKSQSSNNFNNNLPRMNSKRWFILLLFILILLVYFYFFNLYTDILQNNPKEYFPEQSIDLINNHMIFQYGQFVRNSFFSSVDFFLTFIGQLFFRIDKYEYQNNIIYVATSTSELLYDWFCTFV